ncbi:MAG: ATP synthase F1 subunit gamma [Ruminococcaceae bacterium]|nr:ATP synthase F1 subunit gamma [Oscillospiraceae bacterium]
MPGNTKALRVRIKSVSSTLQLTKAMGLVASSKIRRANEAMFKGREYLSALEKSIDILSADKECQKSPYLKQGSTGITRIIVIAGDRGLAGGYNANVFRLLAEYPDVEVIPIGKKACERFGKMIVSSEHFTFDDALEMASKQCEDFANGVFDRLGIISTKYNSVMSQEPYVKWILPFTKSDRNDTAGIIFEPDQLTVLNNVAREYVAGMITVLVRESFASEVAARRMAMDSAGKNAKEMIDNLQLEYNRARQSAITQEITEIVAGSGD